MVTIFKSYRRYDINVPKVYIDSQIGEQVNEVDRQIINFREIKIYYSIR